MALSLTKEQGQLQLLVLENKTYRNSYKKNAMPQVLLFLCP
jgi:hypothetical protein